MAASRCWQRVGLSVTGLNPGVAGEAQRCLVEMPDLESTANVRDGAAGAFPCPCLRRG